MVSQVWWYTSIIPALRKLRLEDGEFQASLVTEQDPVSLLPQKNKKRQWRQVT
jgi:hypothetical protein